MADLAQVAQSGVDPISGSYLSAERRKALFKRSQVSSNIFGGGGALVPISKKSDPETLSIVKSQSTSITSLQGQVNTLSSEVANLNKVIFIKPSICFPHLYAYCILSFIIRIYLTIVGAV